MVSKPKKGDACNHCGLCCMVSPCKLANELLDCRVGPCIALEKEGNMCGLTKRPAWYLYKEQVPLDEQKDVADIFSHLLGIGKGCDSEDSPFEELFNHEPLR
jgi:hypothetical protein